MSEINCKNCAISDFKESLCERCDEMKRLGSADDIEELLIKAFSEVDSPAKSDCISRQGAIDALKAHEDYKGYLHGDFEEILEALPSVQPEVIRCKDCKYFRPMTDQDDLCDYRGMQVFPDDYCSRAEGREDEID